MFHIHCMNYITQQQPLEIYTRSKPMHLLGLGNKFGIRIINTTKTPDKEPTFSFINGN